MNFSSLHSEASADLWYGNRHELFEQWHYDELKEALLRLSEVRHIARTPHRFIDVYAITVNVYK